MVFFTLSCTTRKLARRSSCGTSCKIFVDDNLVPCLASVDFHSTTFLGGAVYDWTPDTMWFQPYTSQSRWFLLPKSWWVIWVIGWNRGTPVITRIEECGHAWWIFIAFVVEAFYTIISPIALYSCSVIFVVFWSSNMVLFCFPTTWFLLDAKVITMIGWLSRWYEFCKQKI
jgi:hypothetical protein